MMLIALLDVKDVAKALALSGKTLTVGDDSDFDLIVSQLSLVWL